jgi:hypothetical protein
MRTSIPAALLLLAASVPAQPQWQQRTPALRNRSSAAVAYDAFRGRLVVFGGLTLDCNATQSGTYVPLADTWEWDGARWYSFVPAAAPSARSAHAMAFDSVRNRVV